MSAARSAAVLEAPALVAGLDDLAVMGQPVDQRSGHLGVAEHGRRFSERGVRGRVDGRAFIERANPMEQQLPAVVGKRQIPEVLDGFRLTRDGREGGPPWSVAG